MNNFELEVYKSFKTLLYNTVSYNSTVVPYFSDIVTNQEKGIYISGYQEQEEDYKHHFGARCFLTLTIFSQNDSIDVTNAIANSVKALIKASVNSSITSSSIDIVLTKSPRTARFTDLDGGNTQHRVELTYELLAYSIT